MMLLRRQQRSANIQHMLQLWYERMLPKINQKQVYRMIVVFVCYVCKVVQLSYLIFFASNDVGLFSLCILLCVVCFCSIPKGMEANKTSPSRRDRPGPYTSLVHTPTNPQPIVLYRPSLVRLQCRRFAFHLMVLSVRRRHQCGKGRF